MALSTVTLVYTLKPVGSVTPASLVAAMAAVPLGQDDLVLIGATLISDTTAFVGGLVQRTLVYSVLAPFQSFQTPVPIVSGTFNGAIVSSSPNDSPNGTGAHTVQIFYIDQAGLEQSATVALQGTTPVNFSADSLAMITSIRVGITGSLGAADGLISVFSGPNGAGTLAFQGTCSGNTPSIQNFQGSVVSSSPNDHPGVLVCVTPGSPPVLDGLGARIIQITYFDKLGAEPFTETVMLNGTTPVDLGALNHATITNIQILTVGSFGSNVGTITIFSGRCGTGARIAMLGPSFFQFFPLQTVVAPAINLKGNIDPKSPANVGAVVAADIAAPFRDRFTHTLGAALVSKITAAQPVFA